jgi:HEAT repeat protein
MFVNPEDQAIAVVNNKQLNYQKREFAVHYLSEHTTPEGIKALVGALRDPEFVVRWAASTALAQLGPLALPEVLQALTNPKMNTVRLREGVIHQIRGMETPAFTHGEEMPPPSFRFSIV